MKKRIGVYICECGSNISDHVDVEKVMEAVRDEEGVALAKITMFACADSTQQEIVRDIEEMELDGLVIASCSPKLHLYTFRSVAERAGLNKYNYVQANIREQGSWAHSDKPREATEKAIRSVKAAIARTKLSQSLVPPVISSENSVLVVGAGIAGMRAAVELADTGSRVYLIDRSPFVGGRTAQWGELFPTDERGGSVVEGLFDEVMAHDGIELYTGCEVMSKTGSVGDFDIKLRISPRGFKVEPGIEYTGEFEKRFEKSVDACPVMIDDDFNFGLTERKAIYRNEGGLPWIPVIDQENCNRCGECVKICPEIELDQEEEIKEIKVGGVVIATGFDPYEPGKGEFGYGEIENVITLQQFRRLMEITGTRLVHGGKEVRNIAYIYCVGSRQMGALDGENKYCSRYCCTSAIHSALLAKKKFENIQNYHFTRGVRTYGKQEIIYEESSAIGDIYLQSFEDDPPEVVSQNGKTTVKVRDVLTEEKELEIEAGETTLLEATRAVGLPIASACGENGACARCGLEILEGSDAIEAPSAREVRIKERNRIESHLRLACRVRPSGDVTVRAAYW